MKAMLTILALLIASSAFAGPIMDIQNGLYAEGTQVIANNVVVTGVRYNGFFASEDPNAAFAGIWVYTGSTATQPEVGDLVDVVGFYVEYYDFSEIDVTADPDGLVTVVGVHMGTIFPLDVEVADLVADGEPYEGCFIRVTDGMIVVSAPTTHGEWTVASFDNPLLELVMDDYWYDDTTVVVGDCYNCATGILIYSYGKYVLEPFEDAICLTDCTVDSETLNLDQLKSLYR